MEAYGNNVHEDLVATQLGDKVSCTYLIQSLGVFGAELMALDSNSSMNRLAIRGLMGEPMAASWTCSNYPGRRSMYL